MKRIRRKKVEAAIDIKCLLLCSYRFGDLVTTVYQTQTWSRRANPAAPRIFVTSRPYVNCRYLFLRLFLPLLLYIMIRFLASSTMPMIGYH